MKFLKGLFIGLIAIMLLWPSANINWSRNNWVDILESDAKGYYAYLPAVFIYQDLNFGHFDSLEGVKYFNENIYYDYRYTYNGKTLNKYVVGTAVLELPFFFLGHLWALMDSIWEADGFSKPYLVMIHVGAIFYCLAAIWLLMGAWKNHFKLGVEWLVVFMVFATNLFYYVISEPGMSHAYAFFLTALFVRMCLGVNQEPTKKWFLQVGIVLGLLTLVRPVNILFALAIPFLLGRSGWQQVIDSLKSIRNTAMALVPFLLIVGLQPLIYYVQTGSFWVYSYGEEGFNWLNPQIWNGLFSIKKGALVYAPILFLALLSVVSLFKTDRFRFWAFGAFILALLYVTYSWWNWWYGGSFGQRVLVDIYPILFTLILIWLNQLQSKWSLRVVYAFGILCLVWCQFQTYQYRYNIIPWEGPGWDVYLESLIRLK